MSDTAGRTAQILARTQRLRQKREHSRIRVLSAACLALTLCLPGAFRALAADGGTGHVPGLCGSALLYGGAGGYMLAGILAFAGGVAVTLLCIRSKNKQKRERQQWEEAK